MTDRVDLEALRALERAATPGPWEEDTCDTDCAWGKAKAYQMIARNEYGRQVSLFDSINSDATTLEIEHDEDGSQMWDEIARRNFAFIAAARNAFPALADEIERLRDLVRRTHVCVSQGLHIHPQSALADDLRAALGEAR